MNNRTTVFNALNSTFAVGFKEFAGLGKLITSIDDIQQNSTHHWFYYVNDKFAQTAADKYILHGNSSIFFRFTSDFISGEYV